MCKFILRRDLSTASSWRIILIIREVDNSVKLLIERLVWWPLLVGNCNSRGFSIYNFVSEFMQ